MIVRLTGGLGNTMFQYAFGRSLAVKLGIPVDFHWCRSTWDYNLDAFNVKPNLVQPVSINGWYCEKSTAYNPEVLAVPESTYFLGYWQSEKYFDEPTVRKELVLLQPTDTVLAMAEQIRKRENSVFIHVRHGDYLTNPETNKFHGILPYEYYTEAMEYMRARVTNPTFFVFSDDIEWCRAVNFPATFVRSSLLGDLYLMQQCKHAIVANSSYSWFGAWLGQAGCVVAPKKWFNETDPGDIIPDRWMRI